MEDKALTALIEWGIIRRNLRNASMTGHLGFRTGSDRQNRRQTVLGTAFSTALKTALKASRKPLKLPKLAWQSTSAFADLDSLLCRTRVNPSSGAPCPPPLFQPQPDINPVTVWPDLV
jgi:hypothetical protein